MTVVLAISATKFIPLYYNIPTIEEAEKVLKFMKAYHKDRVFTIISNNVKTEDSREYNKYEWEVHSVDTPW